MMQTVTLTLPEALYRSAYQVAEAARQPIEVVLRESLAHTLPPLDDLAPEEAAELATLSLLDDASLWHEGEATLAPRKQIELRVLLEQQQVGEWSADEQRRLQSLLDEYGRLMVRKSHAWLLLARRGYRVPPQSQSQG
ncbi:MAG: hypothetical protein AB1791_09425 [Chloroflexota bacterium]